MNSSCLSNPLYPVRSIVYILMHPEGFQIRLEEKGLQTCHGSWFDGSLSSQQATFLDLSRVKSEHEFDGSSMQGIGMRKRFTEQFCWCAAANHSASSNHLWTVVCKDSAGWNQTKEVNVSHVVSCDTPLHVYFTISACLRASTSSGRPPSSGCCLQHENTGDELLPGGSTVGRPVAHCRTLHHPPPSRSKPWLPGQQRSALSDLCDVASNENRGLPASTRQDPAEQTASGPRPPGTIRHHHPRRP